MRYALNKDNEKIEVKLSGQRALCPGCMKEVTGKVYSKKKNHWAHLKADCDKWYEPLSDWHLSWQNIFPKENQEVTLFDEKNGEFHRADIRLNSGVVIEVQNSPIVIKEVSQRENFYNKHGLIWILNAKNLIPKSSLVNYFRPDNCEIKVSFLKEYYSEFDTKDIINDFVKKEYYSLRLSKKSITGESIEYFFNSDTIVDIEFEKYYLEGLFKEKFNPD